MAQNNLGIYYYNGWSVPQNYSQAEYWLRKAAEQGNTLAQKNLDTYFKGNNVAQSNARQGGSSGLGSSSKSVEEQFNLAVSYYDRGDYTNAVRLFRKAAEQGYVGAQCNLGVCYKNGQGVPQNYSQAVYWYRKAAGQGLAVAQYNLGCCYADGRGVSQNYSQAVYWFCKAAEQGDVDAQNTLGVCYEKGEGVTKDYSQAVNWYRKAAEQGYADAQCNLGRCYATGQGVTKDYAQARYWLMKAKEQGNDDARKKLVMLDYLEKM